MPESKSPIAIPRDSSTTFNNSPRSSSPIPPKLAPSSPSPSATVNGTSRDARSRQNASRPAPSSPVSQRAPSTPSAVKPPSSTSRSALDAPLAWACDVCMMEFPTSTAHYNCLECADYDLCKPCFQQDRVSKNHSSSHKTRLLTSDGAVQSPSQPLNRKRKAESERIEEDATAGASSVTPRVPHDINGSTAAVAHLEHVPTATPEKRIKIEKKISPPWKSAVADGPASVIVGGRRVSTRRVAPLEAPDPVPLSQSNGVRGKSPPWKQVKAEGPTSVIVDGRRKSTRTMQNESPPPKKVVRPRKSLEASKPSIANGANGHAPSASRRLKSSASGTNGAVKPSRNTRSTAPKSISPSPTNSPRRQHKTSLAHDLTPTSTRATRLNLSERFPTIYDTASRNGKPLAPEMPLSRQNPKHFPKPISPENRKYATLAEYLANENPLEGVEDYPKDPVQEAQRRLRIAQAAEPGGPLSDEKCTRFAFVPFREPRPKYGHWDFVASHATYFATLRKKEVHRHVQTAARIARAVKIDFDTNPKWAGLRQQLQVQLESLKTKEDLEKDFEVYKSKVKKQIRLDLEAKWNMVTNEVHARRYEAYQKEQEILGKKHLDEMLDRSNLILQQQFGEQPDEDEEDSMTESSDEDRDMITAEDISRYKAMGLEEGIGEENDESDDQSTDMDSETESNNSDSEASDSEEEEQDDEPSLLHMMLPPREVNETDGNTEADGESIAEAMDIDDGDSSRIASPTVLPSDNGSEVGTNASTRRPSTERAVSTPTTSIMPGTPHVGRTEVSPLLRGTLREYQHDGVDWLAKLYAGRRNGILADEMGLGKTIQTIALLAHLATHHHQWGPHLVVVPTSVLLNWEIEFKKWCPGFKIITYYGTKEERAKKRQGWKKDNTWNVCITSYNLILKDHMVFKQREWHYMVLDEAHNIKNFQSQRWQTLLTFKTHSRLLLTGTPLQNNLQELWSLLYFLMPAGLGRDNESFADLDIFMNSMKKPADQILDQGRQQLDADAQNRVSKLHEILRPFLLRRLKKDVEQQMPSKFEHVVTCRLSKRQRQLYDEFMGRSDTRQTLSSGNYMSIIACLMSLRKVCNHPDLFETRQIVTSFPMKAVAINFETKDWLIRRNISDRSWDSCSTGMFSLWHNVPRKRHFSRLVQLEASRKISSILSMERKRLNNLRAKKQDDMSILDLMAIEAQENVIADLVSRIKYMKSVLERRNLYSPDVIEAVKLPNRLDPVWPRNHRVEYSHGLAYLDKSVILSKLMDGIMNYNSNGNDLVTKFNCITPSVIAEDVARLTLTPKGIERLQDLQAHERKIDPFHEARIRQTIAFPDKRLLQYDCGKMQALDKLLRKLQSEGHRCLIFTQMTKVLDLLEQFLNIHGHRYLRLDGATKVEQRQILTDRFNQDDRILAFILSSRSGGLGINLTGADTVIFYDLDWNPAMDKQCQDRCHRIGQTRDVHIYRFVSEFTIEANILRKSNQKRLLDDLIIQRGEFTTDMFQRVTYREAADAIVEDANDPTVNQAMDTILGKIDGDGRVLEKVEDKEDVAATKEAEKEIIVEDDFAADENVKVDTNLDAEEESGPVVQCGWVGKNGRKEDHDVAKIIGHDDSGMPILRHIDEYMLRFKTFDLKDTPVLLPKTAKVKVTKPGTRHKAKR